MLYRNVCLDAFAYTLPEEIVTSAQIEARLEPVYSRLRLPAGRLELMSGIAQRRFWPPGTLPSQISVETGRKAIHLGGVEPGRIGALVHASVCRDFLEPATACGVHQQLGLSPHCLAYDVSNACLGLVNGMVQVANMIELGQIRAGLVVGTESSRALVETTIERLNRDTSLSRNDLKLAFASLTIGSGSAAVLLTHREVSRTGNRLLGGTFHTNTEFCQLCHSGRDETVGGNMRPLMWTDCETLMQEGIRTARAAFEEFCDTIGWEPGHVDKTLCHQVGRFHHKLLFEALGLDQSKDFSTLAYLGNTGSVALPITAAIGVEHGHLRRDDRVALLGVGSGINVLMLAVDWQHSPVDGHHGSQPVARKAVLAVDPVGG